MTRHLWRRLMVPLTALFVLSLVAAGCGDDSDDGADEAALAQAQADAAAAEADAAAAQAEADAAAAAAAEADAALAEAMAAAEDAEGMDAEVVAELEQQLADAQAAAAAAEARAEEAAAAAEEAAMAAEEAAMDEEAPAPAGDPGRVTIAVTTEPSTLDPQAVNDRSSRVVTANLFESLLGRNIATELVPVLATAFPEAVDDDTWRFSVREGVSFHDGQALDAQAVADSLNRMLDPDYSTQRDSYVRGITSAEAVDTYTLDIHTDGVNATLPLQIAQLPVIAPGTGETVGENPVGTGPYVFESWERGQQITAVRNADYWGEAPSIDAFTVRFIPDKQTSLAALQAGEVDLVLDILPEQVPLVPQALSVPATEYSYIALNALRPDLAPEQIRVAMNLAVDKELIAETLYEGYAKPNDAQHLSPGMLGYNPDIGPFPYDPAAATAIMEEFGWVLEDNGHEEDNRLPLEIYAPIGRYLRGVETTQAVATMLNAVGFDTEVRLAEWTRFRAGSRIKGDQPGAYDARYGWNSNEWFDGARTRNFLVCGGSSSKLCDQLVTDLFEQAGSTTDQDRRASLYQQAWARLHENPHAIYLLQQDLIYGATERLVWEPRLDDEYFVSEMSLN